MKLTESGQLPASKCRIGPYEAFDRPAECIGSAVGGS